MPLGDENLSRIIQALAEDFKDNPPSEKKLRQKLSIGTDHLKELISRVERMDLLEVEHKGHIKTHILTEKSREFYEKDRQTSPHSTSPPHRAHSDENMVEEIESEGEE